MGEIREIRSYLYAIIFKTHAVTLTTEPTPKIRNHTMYEAGKSGYVNKQIIEPIRSNKNCDHQGRNNDVTPYCTILDVLKSPSDMISGVGIKSTQ